MQFREVTENIEIEVFPEFIPPELILKGGMQNFGLSPAHATSRFFFAYTVRMKNLGSKLVKLLSRHWVITDAYGAFEEVRGPGVVGETPVLEPGQSFEYTSFCPLPTRTGSMKGEYTFSEVSFEDREFGGREFEVKIPTFLLRDQGEGIIN